MATRHHPMVTTFKPDDLIRFASATLTAEGRSACYQGRGSTVQLAMLDLAAKMENLGAEIRSAAERIKETSK